MKKFSLIKENNEMLNLFSNKNKKFKEYILDNLEFENKDELKNSIELNIESLKVDGKTTLLSIQEFDDKIDFILQNDNMINSVLLTTDWFNTSPAELDINNIKTWLNKGCDTALLNVFNEMLLEIK